MRRPSPTPGWAPPKPAGLKLTERLSTTREQLDVAHAAQARLEAQLTAATLNLDQAHLRTDRADAARAQADRERVDAEKAAIRLEAQLEQTRARVEDLLADRDRLTAALPEVNWAAPGDGPPASPA